MKFAAVFSAMLMAIGVPMSAHATTQKVTVTGALDNGVEFGSASSVLTNLSQMYGQSYVLEYTLYPSSITYSSTYQDDLGVYENRWQYGLASVAFSVNGVDVFTHTSTAHNGLYTMNDVYIPNGWDFPRIGAYGDNTYDAMVLDVDAIYVGCVSGSCGNSTNYTAQSVGISLETLWNVANNNFLSGNAMPDLLAPGMSASILGGATNVHLDFFNYNPAAGQTDLATLYGSVNSVTISAVPEPEVYAMMLAGLGLIGAVSRRRLA